MGEGGGAASPLSGRLFSFLPTTQVLVKRRRTETSPLVPPQYQSPVNRDNPRFYPLPPPNRTAFISESAAVREGNVAQVETAGPLGGVASSALPGKVASL